MTGAREDRRATKRAARAEKHAAKADEKRATATAHLSAVPAGEPATAQARGFEACPCPKDCSLHGDCLLCVSFHGSRRELSRCLR